PGSIRRASLAPLADHSAIALSPELDLFQDVLWLDAGHSSGSVLHGDWVMLAGITVGVDDQIVEAAIRAGSFRIRVPHQADYRPIERDAHVTGAGVRREPQRRRVENRTEMPASAAQLGPLLRL